MKQTLLISLISIFIYSCNNYENKDKYEVQVGETVEIYFTTNSCCYYCLANRNDLKNTKLLERRTIDSGPEDCGGCDFTDSFLFKAESVGIDTIKLKRLEATVDCDSNDVKPEIYIIEVK